MFPLFHLGGVFFRKHNYSFKAASLKVQGGPLQGYRWGYNNPHKQGKKRHLPFFQAMFIFFWGILILGPKVDVPGLSQESVDGMTSTLIPKITTK